MTELTTIIEGINRRIDGIALVRLIDYHVDKIQVSGATLKCFCPIHHELAFRSLIINLKTNTYRCTMKRCPCFQEGLLVELWARHMNLEVLEAGLDLADKLQLDIDIQTLRQLGATFTEKARDALAAEDFDQARALIDQALALQSRNLELRLLSAQIWTAAGRHDRANEEYLALFDAYLEDRSFDAARELLAMLLAEQPDSQLLLERQVELAHHEATRRPEDEAPERGDVVAQRRAADPGCAHAHAHPAPAAHPGADCRPPRRQAPGNHGVTPAW
ncbi:MAG: hypothetical protein M1457_00060 [bacterium]|nr:hypothetical protein [bacterium]